MIPHHGANWNLFLQVLHHNYIFKASRDHTKQQQPSNAKPSKGQRIQTSPKLTGNKYTLGEGGDKTSLKI